MRNLRLKRKKLREKPGLRMASQIPQHCNAALWAAVSRGRHAPPADAVSPAGSRLGGTGRWRYAGKQKSHLLIAF